jgi:hypothetical protein
MSVNVNAVAAQVLAAMKGKLPGLGAAQLSAVEAASGILAKSLADIEAVKAAGQLSDDDASALITSATDDSLSAMESQAGLAALDVKGAVVAGLETLASVALTASGLGWANPILQGVIAAYSQTGG